METNFNSPLKPQAQAHAPSEARIIVDGAGALDSQPESGTDLMKDVLAWQTHDLLANKRDSERAPRKSANLFMKAVDVIPYVLTDVVLLMLIFAVTCLPNLTLIYSKLD